MMIAAGLVLAFAGRATVAQDWIVKPTKEHEILKKDVGDWEAAVKIWPTAGAEVMESKGKETNELLKGGLWLVSRFEGEAGGIPFSGVGTFGYDPEEKKYVGTWVDTMTPHLMISKATYDEDKKTMTGTSEGRDANTKKAYTAKTIARYEDDDTRVFEMYMTGDDGKEWKMMEITYKRKKAE
jgi:hypothetical protein